MRIALGNVLYASNDFRHGRAVGRFWPGAYEVAPMAQGLLAGADPRTGYSSMYEKANGGASRVMALGQRIGPVEAPTKQPEGADEAPRDV